MSFQENNGVEKVNTLEGAASLETLKLSGNSTLVELDGLSSLRSLKSLNLSGTGVASLEQIGKLKGLQNLTELDVSNTPVGDSENAKIEVLILLPQLESYNGEKYSNDDRAAARDLAKSRSAAPPPVETEVKTDE